MRLKRGRRTQIFWNENPFSGRLSPYSTGSLRLPSTMLQTIRKRSLGWHEGASRVNIQQRLHADGGQKAVISYHEAIS